MHDKTVVGAQGGSRYAQILCGRLENEPAGVSTDLAQLHVMRPNGRTAAGALHAKKRVHVVLMNTCEPNIHMERVHVELFTDQGCQASGDALPHL